MKVYVIYYAFYDDTQIIKVVNKQSKAKEICDNNVHYHFEEFEVE